MRFVWLFGGFVGIVGCNGGGELPGHYWQVTALAEVDSCNDPTVPYEQTFDFRVVFDGNDVELAIDEDVFATGTSSGCDISYETPIWTDSRDDGTEIRWMLTGSAKIGTQEDACIIEGDVDWSGTEVFEIVYSNNDDIAQGCEYELEVTVTYQREVK